VIFSHPRACSVGVANRIAGNARLAGLEDELELTGYDYNAVLSVFVRTHIYPQLAWFEK